MKRICGLAGMLVVLLAAVVTTVTSAAVMNNPKELYRAKYPAGVCTPDSSVFILEGNSGSAPTCNDTTEAFFVGNHALQSGNYASSTNAVPVFMVSVSGVPTGVAVDTIRAFVDYSMTKHGPWLTAGQAVPTGWDITCLQVAPTAASDSTGAGHTKYLYSTGSTARSPLSTQPVYKGVLALTGVTVGSSNASPVGWNYARLRLTGDKTTGTLSSLFAAKVTVSFPVDVLAPASPADPNQ